MTPEEAIDYLQDPIGKREKHDEAIQMAIEALEKQIPEKPTIKQDKYNENLFTLYCPTCGKYIAYGNSRVGTLKKFTMAPDMCGFCGQAIDWRIDG